MRGRIASWFPVPSRAWIPKGGRCVTEIPVLFCARTGVGGNGREESVQLGLYVGLPRTARGDADRDHLDRIVVYQRPHELQCPDADAIAEEVARTVVHEVAHHFGLEHGEMGEYE